MPAVQKACPIVIRCQNGRREVLAFRHPSAGNQFIKGTIEAGETPREAAVRELWEESGLRPDSPLIPLGSQLIGESGELWYFFKSTADGLPETWAHETEDDFGHVFEFFWHPLDRPLDQGWDAVFHEAFAAFAPLCAAD